MNQQLTDSSELHNGIKMPWLGLGVWKTKEGDEVINAVKWAIQAGYRSIDTAAAYQNESGVGDGIKQSGIPREELFITTKVWNADQGYDSTLKAFEESRKKLGLDVIDLYLIHWPVKGKYKDTWRAMERLYKDGAVKAIGVSNFQIHHLEDVMASGEIVPMVNQIELHPLLSQQELRSFCKSNKIQIESWSPLMQGNLDLPVLSKLSAKHGKSPAQIILRWHLQNGLVVIPKSVNEKRIQENAALFDFMLSEEEMTALNSLNQNKRFGPDPDNFNF